MTVLHSLCGPRHHVRVDVVDARAGKDPTKTYRLRAKMRADGDRRWQTLAQTIRKALIEEDLVGMRGISRLPHGDKAEGFAAWLREELRHKVLGYDGRWLHPYVQQAAGIARKHAEDSLPAQQTTDIDHSRVVAMQNLAVSELRGIVEAGQQQITRAVTLCLMANDTPHCAANAVSGCIRTMRNRTRAMSEYIIAKTFVKSSLSAFQNAGVTQFGITPERLRKKRVVQGAHGKVLTDAREELWEVATADDFDVCPECEDISDEGPYDAVKVDDLLPVHPWCRCAPVPFFDLRFAPVMHSRAQDAYDPNEPRNPRGEWTSGGGGGGGGGKSTAPRVFKGKPVNLKNRPNWLETDRIGEKAALDFMKSDLGMKDARSLNTKGNNFAVDLMGDHLVIELKTGLASNSPGAQQWNVKLGKPGPTEQAKLDKMSPEKKKAWNARKMDEAMDRKYKAVQDLSKEYGVKLTPKTIGIILDTDRNRADIHVIGDFHKRVGWNAPSTKASYVKTVKTK